MISKDAKRSKSAPRAHPPLGEGSGCFTLTRNAVRRSPLLAPYNILSSKVQHLPAKVACQQILAAALGDSNLGGLLQPVALSTGVSEKITLVDGKRLNVDKSHTARFNDGFRDTKLVIKLICATKMESTLQHPSVPPQPTPLSSYAKAIAATLTNLNLPHQTALVLPSSHLHQYPAIPPARSPRMVVPGQLMIISATPTRTSR